jgi:Zn-dependent peptidase ImmA (M78 family)
MVKGFKSQCESISLQMRRKLDLKDTDALDPHLLADYLDIQVITPSNIPGLSDEHLNVLLQTGADSWSAATLIFNGKNLIILNSAHSSARQASDLMHEISHILLGHRPSEISVTQDQILLLNIFNADQENEANWMSGSLLLPRTALILIKRKGWSAQTVRSIFKASEEMLNYRLNITGVNSQFQRFRRS